MLGDVTRRAGAPSPAPGIGLPGALLRAGRAQLICYPGVYYAGPPSGDRAERPGGAPEPASA